MEDRTKTTLQESSESRKTRKSGPLPMREILEELFVWWQARFPEFQIAVVEMPMNAP